MDSPQTETEMHSGINLKSTFAKVASVFLFGMLVVTCSAANADIIEFIATGAQGEGLLAGNIDPVTGSSGAGAIGESGVRFDTDSNTLFVDVLWGAANGFSDLTGEILMLHLHGPTPSLAPDNFGEVNTDILVNLGNSNEFNNSPSNGGLVDNFFLSNQEAGYLLSGRTYINVHTALYPAGEIRGYLLPLGTGIPEPSSASLLGLLVVATSVRRRRK